MRDTANVNSCCCGACSGEEELHGGNIIGMNIYAPVNGGYSSDSRRYRGFDIRSDVHQCQLRPRRPVHLRLGKADTISITNVEGHCSVWLLPFDESGSCIATALGLPEAAIMQHPGQSLHNNITDWFAANGGHTENIKGYLVFDNDGVAGEQFIFQSTTTIDLWLVIDEAPDDVSHGGGGGQMLIEVKPAVAAGHTLPDPIGTVRDEFTISRSSAKAYEIKAGEYVQIIDVEGRQCSDFMAMRHSKLDQGQERYIDSTVTRSMVGGAYPGPGLYDKFFDQDMKPLIRVARDTVGRHDTFALACTARGYEERGFFGHVNCSDNISAQYKPYGIAARRAWPAINFFFNSWIHPDDNRIQSDEAWSRPGDYVAMQALDDLVCVSTACPDDVDPINGWNPTDIHVRIYKPEPAISHAVAYRSEPDAEPILTEQSAFHSRTSALTESYVVARDVWLPLSYEATRASQEYTACREAVTIQDMSSLRKFDVLGPDAEMLLDKALTRNVSKLALNRGVYALMCDESGSVIDDGTLFRLTNDAFRWCCGSDDSAEQLKKLAEASAMNVWIKSLFSSLPNLAVQGPKSRALLQKLIFTQPHQPSIETMKWFGSAVARLHDRNGVPFQLTRTGYTGELGYEIFCSEADAVEIWDALMKAGEEFAITPMGLEALDTIRIEAGLMAADAEFGPDVDAWESGLGFAVDLKKPDFIGKEALVRNRESPRRMLVGLQFDGNEVPVHGDGVYVDKRQVGVITSAARSPALGCAIAMARVSTEWAQSEHLEVGKLDGHMKRLTATVCSVPFVDPTRERPRG